MVLTVTNSQAPHSSAANTRKDLFGLAFEEFSRIDTAVYRDRFLGKLPLRLAKTAMVVNSNLGTLPEFHELLEELDSKEVPHYRNPELYPYLNFLNNAGRSHQRGCVAALRVHAGLDHISADMGEYRHIWRFHSSPSVYASQHGQLMEVREVCERISSDTYDPVVYKPYPSLFTDIQADLYRGDAQSREVVDVKRDVLRALSIIGRYSPELETNIRAHVSAIAFMDRDTAEVKSFSLRNFYVGGVFVSVSSSLLLAEQLIHEYYHQVLWPWWLIEPPADLPGNDVIVVSPITGKTKPVPVMIQALLIYRSLGDFYAGVLSNYRSFLDVNEPIEYAEKRLSMINRGIDPLTTNLIRTLNDGSGARRFVQFIADAKL